MEIAPIVTEGKPEIHMWINPEWVAGIKDDEIFGCLCHEIMHCLLRHHDRGGGKSREEWAQAADMAINASLAESQIKLPPGVLYPPAEHKDAPAEELYDLLVQNKIPRPKNYSSGLVGRGCMPSPSQDGSEPGQSQKDSDGTGADEGSEGEDPSNGSSGSNDTNDANRAWGEMIAQAASYSRGTGCAKVMARVFAPKPTKTKWARLMRQVANRASSKGGRDTQTFSKTHRRSGGSDFILPGWQSTSPAISVIMDTSGSVSDEMLRSSLTAVFEIAKTTSIRIFLALHDGDCYFSGWIKPETTVENLSALCGQRGGTDPAEAFEAIGKARARFDVCVYLTDGEIGASYPNKPQNVKRMIVGIVGDSSGRTKVRDGWQEILVEI
jgi:predicted metal-dependent peptidase